MIKTDFLKTKAASLALTALIALPADSIAEERTANRSVDMTSSVSMITQYGGTVPAHLRIKDNHDAQWDGIYWNPAQWDAMGWSTEDTLADLFESGVFKKTRFKNTTPTVVVGDMYYELSDLDKRRSVQLLADQTQILDNGYHSISVYSAKEGKVIASYTKSGFDDYDDTRIRRKKSFLNFN